MPAPPNNVCMYVQPDRINCDTWNFDVKCHHIILVISTTVLAQQSASNLGPAGPGISSWKWICGACTHNGDLVPTGNSLQSTM